MSIAAQGLPRASRLSARLRACARGKPETDQFTRAQCEGTRVATVADNSLNEKTVEELRAEARSRGISGVSDMRKEELLQVLDGERNADAASGPLGMWVRDRSLGIFFFSLFLVSWIAQLVVQWFDFVEEQRDHGETAEFWSGAFWYDFWEATLENWQSEFLQLATFTIAAAYLVYKGSSESPDSDERVEQKLDALLMERGLDPQQIERQLPAKFWKR
jgi:Rho termination factor, N-terminal domain